MLAPPKALGRLTEAFPDFLEMAEALRALIQLLLLLRCDIWLKLYLDLLKDALEEPLEPFLVRCFMDDLVTDRLTLWPFISHS